MQQSEKKDIQRGRRNFGRVPIGIPGIVNLIILSMLLVPLLATSSGNQVTSPPDHGAFIYLRKVPEPEYYVELTAEERAQFPALHAALQQLEAGGGPESRYYTSERNASAPVTYLARKYSESTGVGWLNQVFKYGENFYSIALIISDTPPKTSNPQTSTQTPTVSELACAAGVGVLLSGWGILSSYRRKRNRRHEESR